MVTMAIPKGSKIRCKKLKMNSIKQFVLLIVFLFMCTMFGGAILRVIVLQECHEGDVGGCGGDGGGDVVMPSLLS